MLAFTEELPAPHPHTQPIPWTELPHYGLPAPIRGYLTLLYQRLL
jgi:hypothetical protein